MTKLGELAWLLTQKTKYRIKFTDASQRYTLEKWVNGYYDSQTCLAGGGWKVVGDKYLTKAEAEEAAKADKVRQIQNTPQVVSEFEL